MHSLQVHLVSGGSDGLLILWSADHIHDSRELVPKISMKVLSYRLSITDYLCIRKKNGAEHL